MSDKGKCAYAVYNIPSLTVQAQLYTFAFLSPAASVCKCVCVYVYAFMCVCVYTLSSFLLGLRHKKDI